MVRFLFFNKMRKQIRCKKMYTKNKVLKKELVFLWKGSVRCKCIKQYIYRKITILYGMSKLRGVLFKYERAETTIFLINERLYR